MLAKIFTALLVALTGLLPSSCKSTKGKSSAAQHPAATASTANSHSKDLGELSLTNHYETNIELGAGKSCTIKPNFLEHGDVQLTMALQSKDSKGQTAGLSVVQVTARTGKSCEVDVGDMNLTLTPE